MNISVPALPAPRQPMPARAAHLPPYRPLLLVGVAALPYAALLFLAGDAATLA